jgi:hypothetical protein
MRILEDGVDRRSFVLGGAALAASTTTPRAQMPMRVRVVHPQLVQQECPEWCWAASAAMIFGSLGHPTNQMKIVQAADQAPACHPAQTGHITRVLNASWTDDQGQQFTPRIEAAYDQANGITAVNNVFIVNEILQDRPLLYANTHHCMVIVEAYYFPASSGPNVVNLGVLDPWIGSPSFHLLTPADLVPALKGGQMMYLAAVRI